MTNIVTLLEVVAQVESNNNPAAVRFEKAAFEAQGCGAISIRKIIARNGGCSPETAGMIYWSSWGRFQIMGFSLYGAFIDYPGNLRQFWTADAEQEQVFRRFIGSCGWTGDTDFASFTTGHVMDFARFYNGPGNVNGYADKLNEAYAQLIAKVPA